MPKDDAPPPTPEKETSTPEPDAPETAAPETPEEPETPERPANEPTDKAPDKKGDDEPARTLQNAMDAQPDADKKAAQEATAAAEDQKKADEEAAAAEAAKAAGEPEKPNTDERDADLKVEWGPHTHANTRKKFEATAAKTRAARDERDAVIAEREALRKERDELAEKAKAVEPPKELVEEVKTLRERVRELDISKDPIIEAKYDKKIAANNDRIIDVLKSQGFGLSKKADGTTIENPKAISDLQKAGLTLKNLNQYIVELEKADLIEEADAIREAVRENNRIARDKTLEIESWKGDYSKRQQAREQETKAQQEKRESEFRQQTDSQLNAEIEELAKNFSYIKKPAGPLPTDPPAVATAKQKAVADYEAAAKEIETAVKGLSPNGAAPEKLAEVVGRINASAIQAIILKKQVLPRVLKDMAAKDARIKELEAKLGKIDSASRLSRAQGSAPSGDQPNRGAPEPRSFEEALRAGAPSGA